jgi:hypothetical protein
MGTPSRLIAPVLALFGFACMAERRGPTGDPEIAPDLEGTTAPICTAPVRSTARLLTRFELDNTVRDLFQLADSDPFVASEGFPPENRVNGFDNNAEAHVVSPVLVSKYIDAAERVANHVVEARLTSLLGCDPIARGEIPCAEEFLARFLPKAFRRPVTDEELAFFRTFFSQAHAESGFDTALSLTLQVILQSPQFLYRLEPGDPSAPGVKAEPLDAWQLATRLSYLFWGSMPDDVLFGSARSGVLSRPDELASQARRMLRDPKAKRVIGHFHRLWLTTERLETIVKEPAVFPQWDEGLRDSWLASIDAFVEDVWFEGDGTIEALFTRPITFVDSKLAALYGLPSPTSGLGKVSLPPQDYAGLLTQPALMALLANADQASPIKRGVFVREKILCEQLMPPPANIPIEPPDPDPGLTTRERFREHTANEFCASCHVRIDPIGFGFEAFDGMGRFRRVENGKPVDTRGELRSTQDTSIEGPFDGAVQLSQKLARSTEVRDCMVREWFRYAMGRDLRNEDECSRVNIERALTDSGGSLRELLVALVQTDAFRLRAVESAP